MVHVDYRLFGIGCYRLFSYMSLRITFIGRTNFLCFPDATGRRLQPPSFVGYNLREAPPPQFSGYNPLCSSATTGRWIQPPVLSPSKHPKI